MFSAVYNPLANIYRDILFLAACCCSGVALFDFNILISSPNLLEYENGAIIPSSLVLSKEIG
jgi:hypothetical protein